jgi:hypothetical protein
MHDIFNPSELFSHHVVDEPVDEFRCDDQLPEIFEILANSP